MSTCLLVEKCDKNALAEMEMLNNKGKNHPAM
jgi:hypothetical protein